MALANAQPHESRLYYEFSHLYDLLFRRVFYPRIARVIRSLAIEPGTRVLELGVGTGLSLDAYPSHCQVTGIDLAPDMLERAQDKVNRNAWRHTTLEQGDVLDHRTLHVERQWKTSPRSLFTIVVARNAKAVPAARWAPRPPARRSEAALA